MLSPASAAREYFHPLGTSWSDSKTLAAAVFKSTENERIWRATLKENIITKASNEKDK
jgi:hypothetical protein